MYGPTPPVPPSAPPTSAPWTQWPASGAVGSLPPQVSQPRSGAARIGLFVLRAVLSCAPVASIGLLSWVPLLRTALIRRRAWDWVAVIVAALLGFWAFVAVGSSDSDYSLQCEAGMATLCLLALTSTVYFLVTELQPRPVKQPAPLPHPYSPSWPATTAAPLPPLVPLVPLGQVQAELDELSALLHRHERPAP